MEEHDFYWYAEHPFVDVIHLLCAIGLPVATGVGRVARSLERACRAGLRLSLEVAEHEADLDAAAYEA